jgi:hypothetical protein
MKSKEAFTESSKDMLIARYLEETSTIDYGQKERIDLKELGKSMLASMEKLRELSGFGKTKS